MQVLHGAAHPVLASAGAAGPLSASFWLAGLGVFGVFLVVFAETGLLAGFFLPGDSLLFTAGLCCTANAATPVHLSLGPVLLAAVAGALIGAQAGFWLGRRGGRAPPAPPPHRPPPPARAPPGPPPAPPPPPPAR